MLFERFLFFFSTSTLTSLSRGLVQQVRTQQFESFLSTSALSLSETYVHLTPLSDVWHFSRITVMTDISLELGVA